ncbi:putative MFS-type transporter YcaD [Paraburkholderia saeva]|uniref:MFS-type transporter YcaD n=1 Tax=Paraburkholderia saeva TaxID=2777537 RepID=A0A9N8RRU4_9BURK|nr:putative MFS-type transporter YcaD [Paraburkholderia saeva]CAG4887336.1 putative MFS-type transporter YcaD [Paraburkholderia saeva]CAG4901874.1 putative MFS-type transporter YcaD [Paraburkholderia saeva]
MKAIFTRDFLALILSVAVVGLGTGATLPLTAIALTQAGYGTDVVGLLTAAQAGGGLVVVPFAGWVAARFGGRQVIVGTVIIVAVATALMQLTANLYVWALLRVLCGAALMLLFTIGEAWVNQLADDASRGRVIAIYATNFTLFQMAGPVLVSQIAHLDAWRFLLCGAIFLTALPMLATIRVTPHTGGEDEPHDSWQHVLPQMPALVIGTGFFALFDTIALSLMPLFAMAHGVSSEVAVLFASALLLGDTTMQFPIGWLADRLGRERVHIGCAVVVVMLLPALPWAVASPWLCWPLLYVLGAAAGAIYTLSLVACGERFRGAALVSASSLVGASWSAASFGGPLVAGALMKGIGNDAVVGVLLVSALAFLGAALWEKRRAGLASAQ